MQKTVSQGFRLSPQQQHVWWAQQAGRSAAFVVQARIDIAGTLDRRRLARAVERAVERHEILRTTFPLLASLTIPVQSVEGSAVVDWSEQSLAGRPAAEREAALGRLCSDVREIPFDLANGPLLRITLIELETGPDSERHALLLSQPALAADGASLELLAEEIAAAYLGGLAEGEVLQYADLAEILHDWQGSPAEDSGPAFWRKQDLSALVRAAPGSAAPPEGRPFRPEPVSRSIERAPVEEAAARLEATVSLLLLAGWHAALHLSTGEEEIVIGTLFDGRTFKELESALGPFARYLPFCERSTADSTLEELGRAFSHTMAEVSRRQSYFSSELVERLLAEHGASGWSFGFDYRRPRELPGVPGGPTFAIGGGHLELDRFGLRLSIADDGRSLCADLFHDPALLPRDEAERVLERFSRVLHGLLAGTPLGEIDALTEAERRQILAFNRTESEVPEGLCAHHLFEEQVQSAPDAPALVHQERTWTYAELNARSDRLARHLRASGLGPGSLVGLCLKRSPELVEALLGVLKAGAAYVPLDPASPAERLRFLAEDAGLSLLLTEEPLASLFSGGVPVRALPLAEDGREHGPVRSAAPADLAYVIYTSGSTGRPKGVMIPHRGLVNYLLWARRAYGAGEGAGAPVHSSIGFDLTVTSLLVPLAAGTRVLLLGDGSDERHPVEALLAALRQGTDFSLVKLTPAHLDVLRRELRPEEYGGGTRALVIGGEALRGESVAPWREHARQTRLVNEYGPTEATVGCCVYEIAPDDAAAGPVAIGQPIANTRLYVVGRRAQLVPPGAPGELWIGGDGLARGYLGRPELTAERFVPDPFGREGGKGGERLYRTGDLVRLRPDGHLEFLGRIDSQLKIRGFRIEPGEIEAALTAHPKVHEAAVLAREEDGGKRLVAYVVPRRRNEKPATSELRRHLEARLPDYMVPQAFVVLEGLPLTPNGKVDRAALPAPDAARGTREYMAPRTREEEILATLWAQVLRLPRVGVNDNFFELGGDSILSLQIVARAHRAGLHLAVKQLFQHPTVAELARHAGTAAATSSEQGPVAGEVPLTPIQRWFFEQGFADLHHFNQALLLELAEPLDAAALERALAAVVEHHDALRMRFSRQDRQGEAAGWRQENAAAEPVLPFHRLDLSSLPAPRRREALERAASALQAGFDLTAGPLTRLALFETGAELPGLLLWAAHHLVVDAVSWRVLLEDLEGAYRQAARGLRPLLPPKTTSFKDWACRLAEPAASEAPAGELDYWLGVVRTPVPRLPVDFPAGENAVSAEASVSLELTAEETSDLLRTVPSVYHSRIDEALLSALARALAGWTGSPHLLVDLEGHGREPLFDDVDLSRTVGWFTAIHPVVLEAGDADPGTALVSSKERLRAVPGRGVGYGLLRYLTGGGSGEPARLLAAAPVAEICFNYLGQLDATSGELSLFRPSAAPMGPTRSRRAHRAYLLDLSAMVAGGRLRVTLIYGSRVHRRETAERLAAAYAAALRQLIQHSRDSQGEVFSPSDFPKAGLSARSFERLSAGLAFQDVEDLYPLSPVQSGMLFHSLMASGSGVYVNQLTCTLPADLDPRLFRKAWERLAARHGALRTAFLWEGLDEPLQIVPKSVSLPWQDLDWRGLPVDEQRRRFEELRHRDRHTPFSLAEAPLLRFSLIRLEGEIGFIWTFHHLLMDGWSLPLLVQELRTVHAALLEGREPELAPARPFSDYIVWLQKQDPSRAEPFWRGELAGFTAPNPLGIDHPAGIEGASGYAEHRIQVSREVTAGLQALAARHRVTLQTVTLGAWAVLLSRYSSEQDVVFGSVVSGRPAALLDVEAMIGMFINTVPVRVEVDGGERRGSWLQRLQERQLARHELEHSPLVQIQRWSEVPAGSPLFETLYVFENYPAAEGGGSGGLRIGNLQSFETTNYPVTLTLLGGEQISLRLAYDRSRLEGAAALRLLHHLAALLSSMAGEPDRPLRDLSLLSPGERHQLRVEWNDTDAPAGAGATVHGLFAERARQAPGATALVFRDAALSYGELDRRSDRLACWLGRHGAGRESRVGLCLERSPDLVVALLGVLKAGATYVPLDPSYPRERLALVLEDAAPRVTLTHSHLLAALPPVEGAVLCLDTEPVDSAPDGPEGGGPVPCDDRQLAYVLFTSGSTGRPKGVGVPHRALVNFLASMRRAPGFAPGERLLAVTSIAFDIAALEIFLPLTTGGCVELASCEEAAEGALLAARLHASGANVLQATPATWRMLLDAGWTGDPGLLALCGGEALPRDLAASLAACTREVWNLYGPTETTVWSATARIRPSDTGAVSIGRPIANTRIHLLDREMDPVPSGVPGELWIGGTGLARGYLGRPELTAERFLPDPSATEKGEPGGRLYRTGDLARHLPGGRMEVLGRIDHQVKIRGFRIELGEIEAALLALDGVSQAVVVAREGRLVAYVVGDAAAGTLRDSLRQRLPDYMVPAAFVTLAALPLTPNGKVDRRALPAPEETAAAADGRIAPRTPVEEMVAGIFVDLLQIPRAGAEDSFFNLGGHSLLGTQLISRLRESFGVDLPLRVIFERPTVRALSESLEALRREERGLDRLPLARTPREGLLPLSFAQQRLWFLEELQPGSPLYRLPSALRLAGPLDVAVLRRAFDEIVRRHEILRTTFMAERGLPAQVVAPPFPLSLPVIDLSGLEEEAREAEGLRLLAAASRRPFDLARGPLLRVLLLRDRADCHVLHLCMHHIVSDGWSMDVLVREMSELFAAFSRGAASPLTELPVQYADFACWQRSWLQGEVLEAHIDFWQRQLEGAPPLLDLPFDHPRPAIPSFRTEQHRLEISEELSREILALSRRQGVTLFMTLLAAFQATLHSFTGMTDVVVGTDVANRNRAEVERMIGFFIDQLVLRTDLGGDPDFLELLARVRQTALDAYAHQDLPFDKLVEILRPERSLHHHPIFQVKLVLQNTPRSPLELPQGLIVTPLAGEVVPAREDLLLDAVETGRGLTVTFKYNADLFTPATLSRIAEQLAAVLRRAAVEPGVRLSALREELAAADRAARARGVREHQQLLGEKLKMRRRPAGGAPQPEEERNGL